MVEGFFEEQLVWILTAETLNMGNLTENINLQSLKWYVK